MVKAKAIATTFVNTKNNSTGINNDIKGSRENFILVFIYVTQIGSANILAKIRFKFVVYLSMYLKVCISYKPIQGKPLNSDNFM